jgi:predicted nucleic acid-binding protein
MRVCVASGFVATAVLDEPLSDTVRILLEQWANTETELIAPDLWAYEVVSITHKAVLRGHIPLSRRSEILRAFFSFRITLLRPPGIHERASDLAANLGLPAPYDAHYLALSEREGTEFWTRDNRLYNTVHTTLPWVHWVGET